MISMMMSRRSAAMVAISILATAGACRRTGESAEEVRRPPSTEYVVAVDLSTSQDSADRGIYEALLHELAAGLDFGERLVLLKAHEAGVADTSKVRTTTIQRLRGAKPLGREKNARERAQGTASANVTMLFKSKPVPGTDLLATLHTAGELAEGPNDSTRTVLVLLSDMLHCAEDVCMEPPRKHVPDSAWINRRKQEKRLPSIERMCVVVVGADGFAAEGVPVREFWQRYFAASGANFDEKRYVHRASSAELLKCND